MSRIRPGRLYRAQQALRIATERDEAGRVWCQLFPLGEWHRADFPDGKLVLTAKLLEDFIANWRAGGSPPLPVDYNHDEDGPAAGWIEDLRLSTTGELEGAIKWTDDAAEHIKGDKYRYLSPTWAMEHRNRRTGQKGGPWLYGAALLNTPFYDSMPRVAASAAAAALPTHNPTEAPRGEEKHMDKKQICAALGLPEDTADEMVMEALSAMAKKAAAAVEVEVKPEGEKPEALLAAAVKPLEAKLKAAEEETAKLKASLLARDVEALVTDAKLGGKAVEPMREFILEAAQRGGIESAKKLVAALPVTLSTEPKGLDTKPTGGVLTKDDAQKKLMARAEELRKAGEKDAVTKAIREMPEVALAAEGRTTHAAK